MPATIESDLIKARICELLSTGLSLVDVCKLGGFPVRSVIYEWQERDDSFRTRIIRAREIGQDAIIDQCREIVDNATPEDVNVAKLRVWHRQWEAAKRAPKQFGDRTILAGDSENPIMLSTVLAEARKRISDTSGDE
jgi:hypothetical protein